MNTYSLKNSKRGESRETIKDNDTCKIETQSEFYVIHYTLGDQKYELPLGIIDMDINRLGKKLQITTKKGITRKFNIASDVELPKFETFPDVKFVD